MHKQILLPLGLAVLAITPALAGGPKNVTASLDGRAELTDGGTGSANMSFKIDRFEDGSLKGRMSFRFEDPSGQKKVQVAFKPKADDALTGNLSVSGTQALYAGPATISDGVGKKNGALIIIISDRHGGKLPAPGNGDSVWMIVSPDDGSPGFSFAGIVEQGDILLYGQ